MITAVCDILHTNFQHPYAPIKKTTLLTIRALELTHIYSFLTNKIISPEISIQRPSCPIKSLYHQSLATYDYKQSMMKYISNFGYEFRNSNPCEYSPAFLEALANYCEYKAKDNDSSDIKIVHSKMKT